MTENLFDISKPLLTDARLRSPYAARIQALWSLYRETVIKHFPTAPRKGKNKKAYLAQVESIYETDAYNSLSIEGYQVSPELIEKVENHHWNPDLYTEDAEARNALAARGYYEAFAEVKKTLAKIIEGSNAGELLEKDLSKWYRGLFAPMARAGIIKEEELFGYRKTQVYIRNSRHTPPPKEALLDAMEAFFTCLREETHAGVRAVLGHYLFVFIHPYMDGNGRIGRFIMNAMLISGGYSWAVVQFKHRTRYLDALETAGSEQNIKPFVVFIAQEMKKTLVEL